MDERLEAALGAIFTAHLYAVDQSVDPCFNATRQANESWAEAAERVASHLTRVVGDALDDPAALPITVKVGPR